MNHFTEALWLRPHHLLCLQSFVGHGYSPEFVQQMTAVKQQLSISPDSPIKIVSGPDMLCCRCPNCSEDSCTSDKPEVFDQLVLNKLASAEILQTNQGSALTMNNDHSIGIGLIRGIPEFLTLSHALLAECCPGCEWRDLCGKVIDAVEK